MFRMSHEVICSVCWECDGGSSGESPDGRTRLAESERVTPSKASSSTSPSVFVGDGASVAVHGLSQPLLSQKCARAAAWLRGLLLAVAECGATRRLETVCPKSVGESGVSSHLSLTAQSKQPSLAALVGLCPWWRAASSRRQHVSPWPTTATNRLNLGSSQRRRARADCRLVGRRTWPTWIWGWERRDQQSHSTTAQHLPEGAHNKARRLVRGQQLRRGWLGFCSGDCCCCCK